MTPAWLIKDAGECDRLGPEVGNGGGGISVLGTTRGVIDVSNVLPRAFCKETGGIGGDSTTNSGDETSLDESLLTVDRLVVAAVGVGVGVGDLST
jgi:hypothetical protein